MCPTSRLVRALEEEYFESLRDKEDEETRLLEAQMAKFQYLEDYHKSCKEDGASSNDASIIKNQRHYYILGFLVLFVVFSLLLSVHWCHTFLADTTGSKFKSWENYPSVEVRERYVSQPVQHTVTWEK